MGVELQAEVRHGGRYQSGAHGLIYELSRA